MEHFPRYPETNENKTKQSLWDSTKAVLWGKFIVINAYQKEKKEERFQVNNPNLYLEEVEKDEQSISKVSRRKETINIRAEIK